MQGTDANCGAPSASRADARPAAARTKVLGLVALVVSFVAASQFVWRKIQPRKPSLT